MHHLIFGLMLSLEMDSIIEDRSDCRLLESSDACGANLIRSINIGNKIFSSYENLK